MAGTYVIINNITIKINNVGTTALHTKIRFSPVNAITIYRFTPTGGVRYPIPKLTTNIKEKWVISI